MRRPDDDRPRVPRWRALWESTDHQYRGIAVSVVLGLTALRVLDRIVDMVFVIFDRILNYALRLVGL